MWIFAKLLFGGLKGFIKENWKWLIPTIALVVSFFVVSNIYYNKGVAEEKSAWEQKIKEEDKRNRDFETRLTNIVSKFGKDAVDKALERIEQETIYKDRVETIIKNNPVYSSCVVDKEVLDSRNAIRAQGPVQYPIKVELQGESQ